MKNFTISKKRVIYIVITTLIIAFGLSVGGCLFANDFGAYLLSLVAINSPFMIAMSLSIYLIYKPTENGEKARKNLLNSTIIRAISILVSFAASLFLLYYLNGLVMPTILYILITPGFLSIGFLLGLVLK